MKWLLIALGGAVGSMACYGTGSLLLRPTERTLFPFGTLAVNLLGCLVIGYLNGSDEETRYREGEPGGPPVETSRHRWTAGDITYLLPPDDGWHRVRSAGPGDGVSVHVLCRTPADHPHRFYDRTSGTVMPYPFVEVAPGRWRAEVRPLD